MGNYVNFHKTPKPQKKELPDHEVFNNALMRAQAAGEKPSAELFSRIDSEYNKKKEKKAGSGYGGNASVNSQHYSPQMSKRKLTEDEQSAVSEGENRWLPTMFQNYGTPVSEMMASPLKMSLLTGVPVGLIVAGLAARGNMSPTAAGQPALTGLAAGLGGGLGMYWHQQSRNTGLKELMTRLPEGATKRDLLADPAYQADLDRKNNLMAARMTQNTGRRAGPFGKFSAELQKEKAAMSLYSFGAKIAQSACSPCAMPNGPKNKPYTSESPAVTDASQKSEEIGKPPVTETEHSEAKAKQPEEGIKSAANFGKMLGGLMTTPAQAGQSAMMTARNNLKVPTSAPYKHVDKSKFLMNPDQRTESLGWAASGLPGKPTHYSTGPDILPRGAALSSVGNTAARNQALMQGGIVGAGAGMGALSQVGQQPQPPEVKAKAKPPEMIKTQSALSFGAKVAESFGSSVANYGGPRNMLDSVIDTGVKGVNAVKSIPGKIWSAGESLANYGGPRNAMDSVIDAGVAARNGVVNGAGTVAKTIQDSRGIIPRTGEAIANYGGPRNALDTVIDAGVAARNGVVNGAGSVLTGLNNARLSAGRQLGEMWAAGGDDGGRGYQGPPGSTPQVSGKVGPKPDVAGAGKDTGAAGGGILDTLYNNPGYTAAGGLGALGLGGLLYHLNSQPKKKKRNEEEV